MQSDDNKIKIDGYNLIKSDHPSDSKKMVFFCNISTLDNFLVMEICSKSEKCFLTQNLVLSNINDEFPICSVVTGDFNARNARLRKNDIINSASLELDSLTSSAGYTQIIDKSAIAVNYSMSCIEVSLYQPKCHF